MPTTCGHRGIHAELVRASERVGPELVHKLMREMGLIPKRCSPNSTTNESKAAATSEARC